MQTLSKSQHKSKGSFEQNNQIKTTTIYHSDSALYVLASLLEPVDSSRTCGIEDEKMIRTRELQDRYTTELSGTASAA
ncbi:hypothetical protein L1887_36435 [Cichorium endivia]|nr:hypothetical protein L1887_36435 [Cichorium endivia]